MKKLLLPILFYGQFVCAQTGLWLDAGFSKKWSKSQTSGFEIGNRQNIGVGFDRLYLDLSHSYSLIDGLKLEGAYRAVLNEKGDQLVLAPDRLSQRFQLGFQLSILDAFDVGPKRLGFTWNSTQQWSLQTGKQMSSIWRNKLSLSYDVKKSPFTPTFSVEHFYRWNANTNNLPTGTLLNGATVQWRYFIGTQIDLPKKQNLKLLLGLRSRSSGIQPLCRISYAIQL